MNIHKIHIKHLKRYNEDIFNGDLNIQTSEQYDNGTMIETRIYEEDLHIETFYTQHLKDEKRFVSWYEDELE
jgi:hypothetical protein